MIKIEYKKKIFEVPEGDLEKIGKQATKELLDEEKRKKIIHQMGMFDIVSGLGISSCFACGDFEDYTGRCRYDSKVRVVLPPKNLLDKRTFRGFKYKHGETKGLCKKDDIVAVYAIESGYMNNYEVRSTKKNKKKK